MINIVIVEDERASSDLLAGYLKKYQQQNDVQFQIRQMTDGQELMENYSPHYDIIFMDIEMPELDGMKAAQRIRKKDDKVIIVFVTQVAHYAVQGYEVGALDFLVKPLRYEIFAFKMQKILKRAGQNREKSIILKTNNEIYRIGISQLLYVEVLAHKLTYHTENGDISLKGSMKEVETELQDYDFYRIGSSFMVNLRFVQGIEGDLAVVGEARLPISRRKRKEFLTVLTKYISAV